jgi:UDP-glucose 4-epimerase
LLDLLERSAPGVEVHVFSRSGTPANHGSSQVTRHEVDLLDPAAVNQAVEHLECTHLCHMGWLGAESPNRYGSPENKRWVEASEHLFDRFSANAGGRIVHVGSCIEYGNGIDGAQTEDSPLDSDTTYGQSKADVSRVILNGFGNGTTAAVARIFFCYGRHEQRERLVPSIITSLLEGEPLDLTEGRQRRDYIDARDVAEALLALLGSDAEGAFNVGSGQSVEVRRVAEILGEAIGRPELLRFGARPEGADTAFEILADTTRIQSLIGWTPSVTLEDGLQDAIDWWRNAAPSQR